MVKRKAKRARQKPKPLEKAMLKPHPQIRGTHIIKERDGKIFLKKLILEDEPHRLRAVLDKTRWQILKTLAERPAYPADIARRLGIHEQAAYYHIRLLESAGVIQVVNKQELGGALAKLYAPVEYAFAAELPFGEEKIAENPIRIENPKLHRFLFPIINAGKLDADIVVGSPDPHGPNQVRARDAHFAIDVAHFLGQISIAQNTGLIAKLDVDLKAHATWDKNLVLIGGALTNVITHELNKFLPVRFQTEKFPFRALVSQKTGKVYTEEEKIGLVTRIPNPSARDKYILIIAGNTYEGTAAAVLALTRFTDELLKNYKNEDTWAAVIQGLDMDGDGRVDAVKVLE